MRQIVIIANVILVLFCIFAIIKDGFPTGTELLVLLPLLLLPLLNVWYLLLRKDLNETKSLISLFIKRKRLEEEFKLKKIQENINKST